MIVNQNHWSWNLVVLFCLYSRWFSLPIGSEVLVFLVVVCILDVLATHWFWNIGFLVCVGILDGFGYPLILESWLSWFYPWIVVTHWSFLFNMCMLKVLFRLSETTHKLETFKWPRRNDCFEKWCFPSIKQHVVWNRASRLGETHLFNI